MDPPETDLILRESRTARRLGRLFRAERAGGLARRSPETAWRLVERRGNLLAELSRLDRCRRAHDLPASPELAAALGALAQETAQSRTRIETLVAALAEEIEVRRHPGEVSGLRDGGGRLLGRG